MTNADTATNILAVFVIPGDVRSKKNSRQSASGRYVRSSDAHQKWEAGAIVDLMQHRLWDPRADKTGPLSIYIDLWRGTDGQYDPDNMGTSVLDAMVAAKILKRDGYPDVLCVRTRHAGIDRENPRAKVTIYEGDNGPEFGTDITEIWDEARIFRYDDGRKTYSRVYDDLFDVCQICGHKDQRVELHYAPGYDHIEKPWPKCGPCMNRARA